MTSPTDKLPYNVYEIIDGVQKEEDGKPLVQYICWINAPEGTVANTERYVQSKGLNQISNLPGKIDWSYLLGGPSLYIKVPKRLTTEELNSIELKIRKKGVKTWGGGLGNSRPLSAWKG